MRAGLLLSLLAWFLCALPLHAQPAGGADSRAEFIAKYRMGDEADEKARLEQARRHKLEFSTPEQAFKSWQATIVRSNKQEYLDCLHPEFRASQYPDGVKAYIKNVDYLKYWYLAMYATFGGAQVEGDSATIAVLFSIRDDKGEVRTQRSPFQLRRHEGKWLFASR